MRSYNNYVNSLSDVASKKENSPRSYFLPIENVFSIHPGAVKNKSETFKKFI